MKTYRTLTDEIRGQVWAAGEAENLVGAHTFLFQEALAELSKWVDCEQANNTNVVPFCKTFFRCGQTVVTAPKGIVRRLYVIANDDFCDPVVYTQTSYEQMMVWAQGLVAIVPQLSSSAVRFPLGFVKADPSTDAVCGRARQGHWCIYRGHIYITPWIQSMESVVIEWDGIKDRWADEDVVTDTQEYKKAVKLYVQYAHERDYGSSQRAAELKAGVPPGDGGFDQALADLMWQCREQTRERAATPLPTSRVRSGLQPLWQERGLPGDPNAAYALAHIGSYASGDGNESAVSTLARGWNPLALVTTGSNTQAGNYDADVGAVYHDLIGQYTGIYAPGADFNRFWPSAGANDIAHLAAYQAFFAVVPGNQRYYDVSVGDVHFFALNTASSEPDGVTATSAQGEWLRIKLALSTARWKVVLMDRPAYASSNAVSGLRWPFRVWGADLVLSGANKNYERLVVGGQTFINNGLGGAGPADAQGTPDGGSVAFYNALHGAGRLTVSKSSLVYEFISSDGAVQDTATLTK